MTTNTSTVLLVEDDAALAYAMQRFLVRHGYEVIAVHSSMEALKQFDAHSIDLVITDLLLAKGEPHGVSLARTIRHARPGLPVVVVTGSPDLLNEETALPGRVMQKPVELDMLLGAVKEGLAKQPSKALFESRAG